MFTVSKLFKEIGNFFIDSSLKRKTKPQSKKFKIVIRYNNSMAYRFEPPNSLYVLILRPTR